MSVGVWNPGGGGELVVSAELLKEVVSVVREADLAQLGTSLPADFIAGKNTLMKQEAAAFAPAADLADEDLELLIRFFTLAEMQLSGWEGGKKNPVIYLVKILKDRGAFTPELRKWVKGNTDNRYLPNGAVL